MTLEELKAWIGSTVEGAVTGEDPSSTPPALLVKKDCILPVCELLHGDKNTYFDQLACLTGLDNGPEAGTMEVIYNLYSIPYDRHLMLKVELDREKPEIASVSGVWKTADWHEREAFDLLGIRFSGHPDLRRILLPNDWEGHPLRKDYEEQETYHDVEVKWSRDTKGE